MNVEMLKLSATHYHVTRRDEIDQPHSIGGSVHVEAELSHSGAKDTFPLDLRIKISENDFCALGRALIINVLEFSVEGILNHIVLFFRRGVSTNKADVIKFWPYADCGYSLVHRCEPASKFVLINMAAVIDIARC